MCFLIIIGIKGHAKAMKNIINKMIYRELSKHLRLLEGCKFKEKAGSCSIMKQQPASLLICHSCYQGQNSFGTKYLAKHRIIMHI
jgi:hypothetical protein